MEAGHAIERERTGLANVYFGMVLFILSECFLFGSLFWAYYYLRGRILPAWPPEGVDLNMVLASVNTVLLLSSSATMHYGTLAIKRGNRAGLVAGLVATMLLGVTFLGITGWEWMHETFRPWSHSYGSVFYTLTGFHGAHVLMGLLIMAMLLIRAMRGRFSSQRHLAVEVGGLYWHFVDAVWIGVFTTLFIIR